jgi:hypothetical protein
VDLLSQMFYFSFSIEFGYGMMKKKDVREIPEEI